MSKPNPIEAIYARIPAVTGCRKCGCCCGPILMSDAERRAIRQATGRRFRPSIKCMFLRQHKCTIYEHRPAICRMQGTADWLPCPFGAHAEWTLTRAEGSEILDALEDLK